MSSSIHRAEAARRAAEDAAAAAAAGVAFPAAFVTKAKADCFMIRLWFELQYKGVWICAKCQNV